jgi:uncharacterized protein (TIGR02145 family)
MTGARSPSRRRRLHLGCLLALSVMGLLVASCTPEAPTRSAPAAGSWRAAPRIDASNLTQAQMDQAAWVRVQASRFGLLKDWAHAPYTDGQLSLTIQDSGAVQFTIAGFTDAAETLVVWSGSGTIRNHQADVGLDVVTLGLRPVPTTGTVTDGLHTYATVQIGSQWWMAENLRDSGASGTTGVCPSPSGSSAAGTAADCATYGRLYTWSEALGGAISPGVGPARGICPEGWHLPSDSDWDVLHSFVEADPSVGPGNAGIALKTTGGEWGQQGRGIDWFGFKALPAGFRDIDGGSFKSREVSACLWASSGTNAIDASSRFMRGNEAGFSSSPYNKTYGFSVRCVKD